MEKFERKLQGVNYKGAICIRKMSKSFRFATARDCKIFWNGTFFFLSQITVLSNPSRDPTILACTPIPIPVMMIPTRTAHSSHLGNELLALHNLAKKSVLNSLAETDAQQNSNKGDNREKAREKAKPNDKHDGAGGDFFIERGI